MPPRPSISLLLLLLAAALGLSACSSPVHYDRPKEWIIPGSTDALIDQCRPVLAGRRIFLDPGHGGEDRVSHGPAGKVVEADVNLSVALQLRSFLQRAGAVVIMSRQKDTTVSLRDRPRLAVAAGAEVFISLHHNDTGTRDNVTNYSSVYYHSVEGRLDYFPANHDLARYIERDMAYAMRNPAPPSSPSFDGTLSDFSIYPNAGFAVLRDNPLPAVLIEGSFFSHPYEEQKLAVGEFNQIEAWGIFLGLGRYFRSGIPELKLLSDSIQVIPRPTLKVLAGPTGEIDSTGISAWLDSTRVRVSLSDSLSVISITPPGELTSGVHLLRLDVRNLRGNASWPFITRITAMLPVASLSVDATPEIVPPDPRATARIILNARDNRGNKVADGSIIRLSVQGMYQDTTLKTRDGTATFDLHPGATPGVFDVSARADGVTDNLEVPIKLIPEATYIGGAVRSTRDSLPVPGTVIGYTPVGAADSATYLDISDLDGSFFAYRPLPDSIFLVAVARGYITARAFVPTQSRFIPAGLFLSPVADGKLFGATVLIDPRYGGAETGDVSGSLRATDINLAIGNRLLSLLRAAGARPVLVRDGDTTISEHDRATFSGRRGRGLYVRIDASGRAGLCSSEIYPNPANANVARMILHWIHLTTGLDSTSVSGGETPFFREVAQSTISIIVPSVTTGHFDTMTGNRIDDIAWGLFLGILDNAGFTRTRPQKIRPVIESATPLLNTPFIIGGIFTRYADDLGNVNVFGLVDSTVSITMPRR